MEAHGLSLGDASAWKLVAQWRAATVAIVRYLEAHGAAVLDLVDASILAGMFVSATAA